MRYLVFGAGGIGGTIGGKLAAAGFEVGLIARGEHLDVLERHGLSLRDPDGTERFGLPAYGDVGQAEVRAGDVVILAVKSQQTAEALRALSLALGEAASEVAIVCAQNGVENERLALRSFPLVYGMRVVVAATHIEPGLVELWTAPIFGMLDIGRYPAGCDARAEEMARDLSEAGFDARATEDVMAFKYLKLLGNVANALEAACGTELDGDAARDLLEGARRETREVYEAAGITMADEAEDHRRRERRGPLRPTGEASRTGGSSWQSLARGTGNIEADYLNGEIVLLGRLHGVATPVNSLLQQAANEMAERRLPPGSMAAEELLARLGPQGE